MKKSTIIFVIINSLFFIACSNTDINIEKINEQNSTINKAVDITKFNTQTIISIKEVDCTLTNNKPSRCYEITTNGFPSNRDALGPNCPKSITSDANESGTWFDKGVLYNADGEFIKNLDTFYDDPKWKLYDEKTGKVNITNTKEACEAAARPNVDAKYQNHCVQCDISYYNSKENTGIESKFIIPKVPVPSKSTNSIRRDGVGIALDGVKMDAPAPVEAILSAYTIAAFDDCVGHINPHVGYHYHGANQGQGNCPSIPFEEDGHAGMIGYALDGYAIYGMLDKEGKESENLDNCRGQYDDIRGYHYHTAGAGENSFIGCFKGETVFIERKGLPPHEQNMRGFRPPR